MKKTILSALVVLASSAALAGSIKNSAEGVSGISAGLSGASRTTLKIVLVDGSKAASTSIAYSADVLADAASAVGNASLFVIEHPSEAASKSLHASQNAAIWALTTSGQLVRLTLDSAADLVRDPVGTVSGSIQASGRAIRVVVNTSGQVASASGAYLQDEYGNDMKLVMTGSGAIYAVSEGSVVASINGSKATLQFLNDTVVDSVVTSAQDLSRAMYIIASEMPSNAFKASTQGGKQYKNNK